VEYERGRALAGYECRTCFTPLDLRRTGDFSLWVCIDCGYEVEERAITKIAHESSEAIRLLLREREAVSKWRALMAWLKKVLAL
jgi:ribosomal protein L37AE/L43A